MNTSDSDCELEGIEDGSEPTEMSRFSDEELISIYNNPDSGGVLRQYLQPILSRPPGDALKEADNAVTLLRNSLPEGSDPLFYDWHFIYAFLCAERFLSMVRDRLKEDSDPVMFLASPAIALLSYDNYSKGWLDIPDSSWLRAAEAISWTGVIPANHSYKVGNNAVSAMVALKTSPIWRQLGFREPYADFHEPLPFTRDGSRKFVISGVSKKELANICAIANIPYPDKVINAHARLLKMRVASSVANRKTQESEPTCVDSLIGIVAAGFALSQIGKSKPKHKKKGGGLFSI